MGFFGKLFDKKECDLCGGEIGLLGNRKLEDGNMCKNCAKKLSPFFDERRHSTVAQINEQLAYREANKADVAAFHVTRTLGNGTKVSHLTYIGDSDFGKGINVGCGVVTVNYDGKHKYRCTVEDDCFIGCNTNLVAPVTVGKGSYIAAGSTITEEVPEDAMVVARCRATVKPLWAKKRREDGKL